MHDLIFLTRSKARRFEGMQKCYSEKVCIQFAADASFQDSFTFASREIWIFSMGLSLEVEANKT